MTMKTYKPTFTLAILIGIGSLLVLGSQAQNLILNGSFEAPGLIGNAGVARQQYLAPSTALTGWTLAGTGDVYLHKSPGIGGAEGSTFNFAQNGDFYLDLSGSGVQAGGGVHGTIYQDFSTTPFA